MNIHQQKILILDFGSQYTQLIARRVREAGVYCEIHHWSCPQEDFTAFAPKGVILSGSPESANLTDSPAVPAHILHSTLPILGICYGMQTLAEQLGGKVEGSNKSEFGYARIEVLGVDSLLTGLDHEIVEGDRHYQDVWMSHGDKVTKLPVGFVCTAATDSAPLAAMMSNDGRIHALQFHPEVTHTRFGQQLLNRFVHDICGCERLWTPANIIDGAIATVRKQVGKDQVLLGLSGGVDSSVVAALLHRAIGDQLTCVFVDNGLLRLNEGDQVMEVFARNMGVKVIRANAEEIFLGKLKGVGDPEAKRKIIGTTFIDVFDAEAAKLFTRKDGEVKWLAQGTIYPDVIESAKSKHGTAHVIKSHHNVGGLPENMKMGLVEPLRELFKDEVRRIGVALGLPPQMVYRHPFPGPGLGVRILGEVKKEYADVLRRADAIFIEELHRAGWYDKTSQAFAVFLPVKSVGVVGDARRYSWVIALRAVETIDFMTARWAHLPYELLETVSNRIINEIREVSRVSYDISSKPPATIEWE
ncbi:MAG TPA: glutamine-hydrolyzing GMP synthase [Candidatus Acidoferrum sp.]|nr:glutamine-hydrolyzing GMP synthase [Candidatus Acidoferrum sp.]